MKNKQITVLIFISHILISGLFAGDSNLKMSFWDPTYIVKKMVFTLTENGFKISRECDEITDKILTKPVIGDNVQDIIKIKGDFNGDGIKEYMWMVEPKLNAEGDYCIGACDAYIQFSNSIFPKIKITDCIGGLPKNLGDLNGDGRDEIGLLPTWFTSCWHSYLVWTFRDGKWIKPVDPIPTHCMLWDMGEFPIAKHPQKPGYVNINYNEFEDDDIKLKKKVVKMR